MNSSFFIVFFLLGLLEIGICSEEFCSKDEELCRRKNIDESKLIENYGQFSQHRALLKDHYRIETYRQAIFGNIGDFKDKVVLDVGAGIGILSLFAAQAGAKIVYAVEPSSIAEHTMTLVRENGYGDVIKVLKRSIEDILADELEPVDTIIADPFGFMAVHERMIEKVIIARDRFLKPQGKMYPRSVHLYLAPFFDPQHHQRLQETTNKWRSQDLGNFHGVNLTALYDFAKHDYFQHMIIENYKPDILLARPMKHVISLKRTKLEEVLDFEVSLKFEILKDSVTHGIAVWFEAGFLDGSSPTWLSTMPGHFETHWNQVRFMFRSGMKVGMNAGAMCIGNAHFNTNEQYGYDVTFTLTDCPASDVAMTPLTSKHTTQTIGLSDLDMVHYAQIQRHLGDNQRYTLMRQALLLNPETVANKVVLVLDATVCALPVIAVQAGARKVYAQEAVLTDACKAVVAANNFADKIEVFGGSLEDHVKEKVDLIISNQFSYLYFHLKYPSKLIAAKKFLKPNGRIFPGEVKLHVGPFADTSLVNEWQNSQTDVWSQSAFHGVDLTSMLKPALEQQMSRPIIDTFLMNVMVAPTSTQTFSLAEMNEDDLNELTIPVDLKTTRTSLVDGLALWFDLELAGSDGMLGNRSANDDADYALKRNKHARQFRQSITLSTAPSAPQTTVWQVRTLFNKPLFVEVGQRINGTVTLKANNKRTYDIVVDISAPAGKRQATYDLNYKMGRKVQLSQGPTIGFVSQSVTEQVFNAGWRPPMLTEAQQQQQQQQQMDPQRQPFIKYIYDRIYYYYFWTKHSLIGRVTGSSLF